MVSSSIGDWLTVNRVSVNFVILKTFLPLVKLKHHKITNTSSCGMVSVLAIAVHTAVVRIPAVAFFRKLFFLENFLKIRVKAKVILGKGGERRWWKRGERPNILNIVASRNYVSTFDSQQLATLLNAVIYIVWRR